MLKEEEIAEIRRLYYVEHLKIRTISKKIGRHHSAVRRVLFPGEGEKSKEKKPLPLPHAQRVLENHREFIEEKFRDYPELSRPRLLQILQDKGLQLSLHQLRRYLRKTGIKKKTSPRAFIKVRLIAGEQAQVDWADCGRLTVDGAKRRLSLFAMVLSYSRLIFARFYVDQCLESFLQAHVHAFKYFDGVPDRLLYDNLKTAVTSRAGRVIQFNKDLLSFASRYCFALDACNPRSGWEKGRVERAIRYIKESFLMGRSFDNLHTANETLMYWLNNTANQRPWPEDRTKTVRDVWNDKERKILRKVSFDDETIYRPYVSTVKKTPYVRFDGNDYSVPHAYVQESVIVFASEDEVRIFLKDQEIAKHRRSYGKGQDIETREHVEALLSERLAAREQTRRRLVGQNLIHAEEFFKCMAGRGQNISLARRKIYKLFETYSLDAIDQAMLETIQKGVPSLASLECVLTHKVDDIPELDLSHDPRLSSHSVKPHNLSYYDPKEGSCL